MDFVAPFPIHEMNEKPLTLALTASHIDGHTKVNTYLISKQKNVRCHKGEEIMVAHLDLCVHLGFRGTFSDDSLTFSKREWKKAQWIKWKKEKKNLVKWLST